MHCFVMQNRDEFFPKDGVVLEDLSEYATKENREKAIAYFADSDLPNTYFLQQFSPENQDEIFKNHLLWKGFAEVLVKRGLPRVCDVKQELLDWAHYGSHGSVTLRKFIINNKEEFFPGVGLILEDLWTWDREKLDKAEKDFAASDLPNSYFLQHFNDVEGWNAFGDKGYWDSFASILVKRGLPRISDVKKELLSWFQDGNWPGSNIIYDFVMEHGQEFLPEIKEVILQAVEEKDEVWAYTLIKNLFMKIDLTLSEDQKEKLEEILKEHLFKDDWKKFKANYGGFIRELCKS